MKKISRRRSLIFAGVLLITVGVLLGGSFAAAASPDYLRQQDYITVSVSPTASSPSAQLAEDDIADISDTLEAPVTWWGETEETLLTDRRSAPADVLAVGGPFSDFHPLEMLAGSFLLRTGGAANAIVLDIDLAWQLFGTIDAVGMEVELGDKTYTVTGVCDTDETLLGLLSGSGTGRAYIEYSDVDDIPVAGMETALPNSVPGQSADKVKSALASVGKQASGFLVKDYTEQALLDAESAGLPLAVLGIILTLMLILLAKQTVSGMARSLRIFIEETYFRDSWRSVLRRLAVILAVFTAAAGVIYTVWLLADFPFYLPSRYIPASWIDLSFYKTLIQSEAQTAAAALSFPQQPWDIMHGAAMRLSGLMNMISLAGFAVLGAGLCMLRDVRETDACTEGWRSGLMDIPALWAYFIISLGIGSALCAAVGLPVRITAGTTALVFAGLTFWAMQTLYKGRLKEYIRFGIGWRSAIADGNRLAESVDIDITDIKLERGNKK